MEMLRNFKFSVKNFLIKYYKVDGLELGFKVSQLFFKDCFH